MTALDFTLKYWPLIGAGVGFVVWLTRLEAGMRQNARAIRDQQAAWEKLRSEDKASAEKARDEIHKMLKEVRDDIKILIKSVSEVGR